MKFFVLLDTSGSMEGAKIGALNDAMSNILVTLQGAAFDDSPIELAIMTFGKNAQWMYDSPRSVMDYGWKELKANGMTPLGSACQELDAALKSYTSLGEKVGIIVLSDGCPTDDFESGISLLKQNAVFTESYRYALALGDNADIPSLRQFVIDDNHVYNLNTVDSLFDGLSSAISDGLNKTTPAKRAVNSDSDDEWD
jgi:uncharacterized protein YegL